MNYEALGLLIAILVVPAVQFLKKRLDWADGKVFGLAAGLSVAGAAIYLYFSGALDVAWAGGYLVFAVAVVKAALAVMGLAYAVWKIFVSKYDGSATPDDPFPLIEKILVLLAKILGAEVESVKG